MTGILCIDKPAGVTSFGVVAAVRRLCSEKKVGHAGTLDPMATGVLPVFLGRATRAAELLPCHDKAYLASFRPGITTDTGDITGSVLHTAPVSLTREQVEKAVAACKGEQQQLPPMYSAVRVGGKHLYELARQGKEVERAPRSITVYDIALLKDPDANTDYQISVRCSKGTYIRTLCEQIGERLGCGATMTALRRTMAAGFTLADCVTLDEALVLAEEGRLAERVRGLETAFLSLPAVTITPAQAVRFANGGELFLTRLEGYAGQAGACRVKGRDGAFLGLGKADPEAGELTILLNRT